MTGAPTVVEIIARLPFAIARSYPAGTKRPTIVEELETLCGRASLAWPVRLATVGKRIDRRSPILSGPLFTSVDHPWPSKGGAWLEPVLQLDLATLGRLRGISLGEEWLQLWMDNDSGLIRLVPNATIADAPLAPLPSTNVRDYHERLRFNDDSASPAWLDDARAIVGWEPAFFDYAAGDLLYATETVEEELKPSPKLR